MANNLGDFDASAVIYGKFTTVQSTGAPFTLAGTPALSVYKDNSTTQSTSGVTLTPDFDSVTGLNHFTIDTSSDGTFYSAGSFFDVVITTGTVNSVSVVGYTVGQFTIRKVSSLKPTTAGRTLDVSSGGEAGLDWANIGSPTTAQNLSGTSTKALEPTTAGRTLDVTATGEAGIDWSNIGAPTTVVNLSGTTISTSQVVASVTGAVGSVTGNVGGNVSGSVGSVTGNVGGNVVGSVGSVTARVTANVDQIDGAAWSTHVTGMAPSDLRDISGSAVDASSAQLGVNVVNIRGTPSAGVAGYVGPDWSSINAPTTVVNLSGTTIKAVMDTVTASANVTQWAGSNVVSPAIAGVPVVDVSYVKGTLSPATAGYFGVDWSAINAPTTVVNLSGTTIKTAADLATAIAALPTANQNAEALLTYTDGIAAGITPQGAWRVMLAAVSGKSDGFTGFASTVHYRDPADTKNVITADVDAVGNRTSVTLNTT